MTRVVAVSILLVGLLGAECPTHTVLLDMPGCTPEQTYRLMAVYPDGEVVVAELECAELPKCVTVPQVPIGNLYGRTDGYPDVAAVRGDGTEACP